MFKILLLDSFHKKVNVPSLERIFLDLHWLKVRERIVYKLLLIIFKCIHQEAPESLCKMISYSEMERNMRLQVPMVKSKYGERAYSLYGPK